MGDIVTFYSFKGGVGRSMSLANIAIILGRMNKKVLMVDWDLEAPGLDKYFAKYIDNKPVTGLIDLLSEIATDSYQSWSNHVTSLKGFMGSQNVTLLSSGLIGNNYHEYLEKLNSLDWREFFNSHDGGIHLERLRVAWAEEYDFVLIDSRTGVSDSGGVCTILFPDVIVPLFTANEQSLMGVKNIIIRSQEARQKIIFDRLSATILPVFSRFEGNVEHEMSKKWLIRASEELKDFYDDWVPSSDEIKVLDIIDKTKIPYIPYYSFGENIAVIEDELDGGEFSGVTDSYTYIAYLLATDMGRVEDIFTYAAEVLVDKGLRKPPERKYFYRKSLNKTSIDLFSYSPLSKYSSHSKSFSDIENNQRNLKEQSESFLGNNVPTLGRKSDV